MKQFLNYLIKHPKSNFLIAISYFILVVLPHELVGKMVVAIFKNTTRDVYQNTVLFIGIFALGVLCFLFYRNFKRNKVHIRLLIYLLLTLGFMFVSFKCLIIHNIEIIHFAQYFILSLLLYPLLKRFSKTMFWCTFAGIIDEAYQYFYLAPDNTNYFDFNDIVLNQLGAALGIIFIVSMGYKQVEKEQKAWFKSPEILTLTIIVGGILALSALDLFSVYPPQSGKMPIFLLVKKIEPDFWTIIPHLNARFHILRPFVGTIFIVLLWFVYAFIGERPFKKKIL